jgi:rod shape determining protein RodA
LRVDYKLSDKFDFMLFIPALLLMLIGFTAVYSATLSHPTAGGNFERQVVWGILSLVVFIIVYFLPTNWFKSLSIPVYLSSILLLLIVITIGKTVSGQKSWLIIGPLGFQPSELAKLGVIMALASFLSKKSTDIESFKDFIIALTIGFLPVILILLEPDLGSSIIFIGMMLLLIFWKGISIFGLFVVLSPAFVAISSLFGTYPLIGSLVVIVTVLVLFKKDLFFSASVFALNLAAGFFTDYVYHAFSPHQQRRIEAFIDPMTDPLGSGYNSIQAKVAIGSGGLFGKGYLAGNQTQLQYIPEQWTDFIYCVIGEEFGFVGSVIVLMLFTILFVRLLKIAASTKDEYLSLVVIGVLSVYFIQYLINVGMVIGLFPVIGIPLPFVSYGGSSLLVNVIMLGMVSNIYRNRKNYT